MLHHVSAPDGVRIACETGGEGPPLVTVHGAGAARWLFDLARPHLERSFTVTTVDRRGRGDSGDGDSEYALAREFEDIAAVVRAAGEHALLFGHSYGALVAAGAATRLHALPRLALYEPPMGGVLADVAWVERFEERLAAGDRPTAVREFLRDVGGYSEAEIDAMEDTPAWRLRLAVADTVPRELRAEHALALAGLGLAQLDIPCLLLLGSQSPPWAGRSTEAFSTTLPDARVRPLDGHGHGGLVSAPELVAQELGRFLLG